MSLVLIVLVKILVISRGLFRAVLALLLSCPVILIVSKVEVSIIEVVVLFVVKSASVIFILSVISLSTFCVALYVGGNVLGGVVSVW